jgi:hypothetical protein
VTFVDGLQSFRVLGAGAEQHLIFLSADFVAVAVDRSSTVAGDAAVAVSADGALGHRCLNVLEEIGVGDEGAGRCEIWASGVHGRNV